MKTTYSPRDTYIVFHIAQSNDNGKGYCPCTVRQMWEYLGVNSFADCKMTRCKELKILSNKYSEEEPNTTFPTHNGRCIAVDITDGELMSIGENMVTEMLSHNYFK